MLVKAKTLCFNAGTAIAFISYLLFRWQLPPLGMIIVPIVVTILAGVLKEARDYITLDGNSGWMNIVWTAVGGIVGVTFGAIFF